MTFLLLLVLVVFLFAVLAGARGPIWGNKNVTVIRRRRRPRVIEEVYEDEPVVVERIVER